MTQMIRRFLIIVIFLLEVGVAAAHQGGRGFIQLIAVDDQLQMHLEINATDLSAFINQQSNTSVRESKKLQDLLVVERVKDALALVVDEREVDFRYAGDSVTIHSDGLYRQYQFTVDRDSSSRPINSVVFQIKFDRFPYLIEQALIRVTRGDEEISLIASPEQPKQRVVFSSNKLLATYELFFLQGIKHIFTGWDHQLFLICLMLPLILGTKKIQNVGHRDRVKEGVKVVTAFTLSHSITLTLAALGLFSLPERLVESVIAFSIVVAATLNIQQRYQLRQWTLALFFGLIHGVGFAGALSSLGLSAENFLHSIVAFNIGVEVGQIAIVLFSVLILSAVFKTDVIKRRLMYWGSALIATVALFLTIMRLFSE
jgi:hypothetical protein